MNKYNTTTVTPLKFQNLLRATKRIVKHHNELMVAKGDHFNLFSVLNIETKENRTHSAFLAELLNPKGTHLMGDVFLKLFLVVVKHNDKFKEQEDKKFSTHNAFVKVEHGIGNINLCNKVNENRSDASGGRIDIFLRDKKKNVICIENKIHAIDQEAQIQRYCNYKTHRNTVYYLTLTGEYPSDRSRLQLEPDTDFFNISYRTDIVTWLELCLKEVPNFTGLRESINQYILLIKKLTKTMNKEQEKELIELMMANVEESSFIATNFDKALNSLRHNFRKDILIELKKRLNEDDYLVEEGNSVDKKYAQLWIHLKSNPQPYFLFGVESFSGRGHNNGDLFVGIMNAYKSPIIATLEDENKISEGWRQVRYLITKDQNRINLGHNYTIKILNKSSSLEYKTLITTCCDQIVDFIKNYEIKLPKELYASTNV